MSETPGADHLTPEAAQRLAEFARACKAAARVVSMYPAAHPAIRISISRLTDIAAKATASHALSMTVLPDSLEIEGLAAARPDPAVGELAALLHEHLVGALTVHAGTSADTWLAFLGILAQARDDLRGEGGIDRVWSAKGDQTIEVQEVDYAEVLREREEGMAAAWEQIVANCLQTDSVDLDEETLRNLLDVAGDADRLAELVVLLEERGESGGVRAKTAALLRMLRGIVDAVSKNDPTKMEKVLRNMSVAMGGLSPELMVELLSGQQERAEGAADLVLQVVNRMSDETVASFVAKNVVADQGATGRLAQAFQALVPETDKRRLLLEMAEAKVAESPLGQEENFPELMSKAKDMLTSYSDESFVSDEYARELSSARTQAVEIERLNDDPPERLSAWLSTVADTSLRSLDLQLLIDLLTIEKDPKRWREVVEPTVFHIEDLLLVGDFEAALQLVEILVGESGAEGAAARRPIAKDAIGRLVRGGAMWNQAVDFRSMDDNAFELVKKICHTIGSAIILPMAEALSTEQHAAARQRLTALLISFGADGKQSVESLKNSANPAVRRTAVYLLREFGGSEALPELTRLLDDAEPNIQREALRAIVGIGTEEAYDVLRDAMASGSEATRNSLMLALVAMRDERAAPLFGYIIRNVSRRGVLRDIYLRSIDALGALRDAESVELLKEVLYEGEWWAPFRTAKVRAAVAEALMRVGTPAAMEVLQEAATEGPHGVRAAARSQLT